MMKKLIETKRLCNRYLIISILIVLFSISLFIIFDNQLRFIILFLPIELAILVNIILYIIDINYSINKIVKKHQNNLDYIYSIRKNIRGEDYVLMNGSNPQNIRT